MDYYNEYAQLQVSGITAMQLPGLTRREILANAIMNPAVTASIIKDLGLRRAYKAARTPSTQFNQDGANLGVAYIYPSPYSHVFRPIH